MQKILVFDFDGTLANTTKVAYEVYLKVAGKSSHNLMSENEFLSLRNLPLENRFKKYGIPLYKIPKLFKSTIPLFKEHIEKVEIFPGIKDLLLKLKDEGYRLIILSSNSKENIIWFLTNQDIMVFDKIITKSSIFGKDKKIKKLISSEKVERKQIVYIGDESRDIKACKKAKIKMIASTWGYDSLEVLEKDKPDYLVDNTNELYHIIKKVFLDEKT